jgi:hypothetical protein
LRGEESSPAPAAEETGAADVPPWLRGEESSPAPATEETGAADVPPWLMDAPDARDEGPVPTGEVGLPAWLRGDEGEQPPASTDAVATGSVDAETPELRVPPEERRGEQSGISDAAGNDFFGGADLPRWLQPREPEMPAETADSQAFDWLSRLGGQEDDSEVVATTTAPPPVAITRKTFSPAPAQREAAMLLRNISSKPFPDVAPQPIEVETRSWRQIGLDQILYLVLVLVVLAGLLLPPIAGFFPVTAPPPQASAPQLHSVVSGLSEDDIVLLAYEWNAQRSSELVPLERALTEHLIDQRAKMLLVSTDVQGTLLSFDIIGPLREAGYNVDQATGADVGGRDYVLLGYRPGGDLALRTMAQNLRAVLARDFAGRNATGGALATNFDGTPRLNSIADLSLIVVMADQPQFVQSWMEQVHSRYPDVPIAFLLPAEAAPPVQPYLQGPGVHSLVGIQGAFDYRALRGEVAPDSETARSAAALSISVLTFVLLVIVGGLVQLLRKPRTREETA